MRIPAGGQIDNESHRAIDACYVAVGEGDGYSDSDSDYSEGGEYSTYDYFESIVSELKILSHLKDTPSESAFWFPRETWTTIESIPDWDVFFNKFTDVACVRSLCEQVTSTDSSPVAKFLRHIEDDTLMTVVKFDE